MNLRDAFLKALAENEDDTTTRLVYADWLEEQGEHEEADRERKWPAAKEWLVRFCKENWQYPEVFYKQLIEFGRQAAKEESPSDRVYLDNENMWHALQANSQEFWKNWSVVTGVPVPLDVEDKSSFSCSC